MKNKILILIALCFGILIFVLFHFGVLKFPHKKPNIDWVSIPSGTFIMGSPTDEGERGSDEIQHQVTISAFKMSKYEITFDQYDAFCEATGRYKPFDQMWGRGNRPVINVNWDEAAAFATWMGCRLPTEAEWEYACRAGTTTPFSIGNNITTSQVNYNGNYPYKIKSKLPSSVKEKGLYREKTLPVGSFKANAFGLFDMHGNVWEWCNDWYGEYLTKAQINPKGPSKGDTHVFRGGGWFCNAYCARSAFRYHNFPTYKDILLGFRVVALNNN